MGPNWDSKTDLQGNTNIANFDMALKKIATQSGTQPGT